MKWVQAHESRDCGAACLAAVALHYGVRLDVGKVAILADTTMQGARLDKLRDAAHTLGFAASCGKLREGQIGSIPLPAILHLHKPEGEHYVVLLRLSGHVATVADPSIGIQRCQSEGLLKESSGFVLLLKPDECLRTASKAYQGQGPLRITLDALWQSRVAFSLASVVALLAVCTSLAIPFFISRLIDRAYAVGMRYTEPLSFTLALFIVVAIARAGFTLAKHVFLAGLSVEIEQRYLSRFIQRVASLPLDFFDRCHPGDLIARVNDAALIRSAIAGPILSVVLDIAYLAVASLVLFRLNVVLLAITVASVVGAYALHSLVRPGQVVQTRLLRTRMTELMGHVLEAVTNIRLLKTFGQEQDVSKVIGKKHTQALAALRNTTTLAGWSTTAGLLINGIGMAALIVVAQKLIVAHQFTPGNLTYVVAVSSVMMASTETLAMSVTSLEEVALSAERLMQTERATPEHILPMHPIERELGPLSLEFRSVTFAYGGGEPVLDNVSFSVAQGEVLGIRGESGSGKSTLAVMCNGLYQTMSGQVYVLGRPVQEWNLSALRERVLIVFSDSNLISGTIRDNLTLGVHGVSKDAILNAATLAFADDFIQTLPNEYSYRVGHMGFGLSSGQRQRIALARMFLVKPEVLILDEATSNLDVAMEREILQNLLMTRKGLTTVLISHRPETLTYADRILEMAAGKIISVEERSCSASQAVPSWPQ